MTQHKTELRLTKFTNPEELEDFLAIAQLSVGMEKHASVFIPVRKELTEGMKYTISLSDDYELGIHPRILYVLRNAKDEIIGTLTLMKDGHCPHAAQIEYVAIRADMQGRGYGRFMLDEVIKIIAAHSDCESAILTTGHEGAFYEKCGFKKVGSVDSDDMEKYFYTRALSGENRGCVHTAPHQMPLIGVHLMLIQDGKLLLQKRKGGVLDGTFTPVSGHVDKHEGVITALIREAKEEANIDLNESDLKIEVVAHLPDAPYKGGFQDIINFFVFTDKYSGTIRNNEPDKTESFDFYDLNNLPDKLMSHIFEVLKAYKEGRNYFVYQCK